MINPNGKPLVQTTSRFVPSRELTVERVAELVKSARLHSQAALAEVVTSDVVTSDLRDSDLIWDHNAVQLSNRSACVEGEWTVDAIRRRCLSGEEAISFYGFGSLTESPVWGELELTDHPINFVAAALNLRSLYGTQTPSESGGRASWLGYFDPVTFGPGQCIMVNLRAMRPVLAGGGRFTLLGVIAETVSRRLERMRRREQS